MARMRATPVATATGTYSGNLIFWGLLIGAFVVLLISDWLGVAPAAMARISPGLSADTALLAGLLTGLGMGFVVVQRRRSDVDAALRDPATGLLHRAHADVVAARFIARDDRDGVSRLALAFFEIADHDVIVSRHGQEAFERLLAMVAETLRTQCRGADLPFLFDHRVLGVYLTSDGLASAEGFAKRIEVCLASQQLDWRGDVLKPAVTSMIVMRPAGQPLDALQIDALAQSGSA